MQAGNELGITQSQPYGGWSYYLSNAQYTENDKYVPLFANTFPRIRMLTAVGYGGANTTYPNSPTQCMQIWVRALKAYKPSIYVLYGATNNLQGFNPQNYPTYITYLLQEAQWAQDNGMDAFCIGNENLITSAHASSPGAMAVATLSRTSNVATATFATPHGLTTGDRIFVSGSSPSNFNVADSETVETVQCTVIDSTTITYPSAGTDGAATGTIKLNWSALEVVRKTKALGVMCQAIFTRGPIQYSESQGHETAWITLGIIPGTDIDLIGINGYGAGTGDEVRYAYWKTMIDNLWAAFGSNLIITEHNVVQDSGNEKVSGLDHRHIGFEYVADREIIRRYEYAKNLGISQIYLYGTAEYPIFCNTWPSTDFDNAYMVGDFKPIIDKLKGGRITKVLIGNNTLT